MPSKRNLTAALIVYRQKTINHRLRFGEPVMEARLDWRRKLVGFTPGSTFGYVRWRANQFGTQDWRLFVLHTARQGVITSIPGVLPGADILLATRGTTRTKRALSALDALEHAGNALETITPAYWRHLSNRLATAVEPHGFSSLQAMSFEGDMP